ncbi:MAG: hypothetical protein EZS28_004142 [Streblomastix strix]|uniref:Uncharacterized protein n=1 Tax=Streblomastix strix TaxID=222440 RepID=A0A5J4X133_9EUKA|nr:MAG: hypothetical protein EZS28_004142 [Streblomastix strix]
MNPIISTVKYYTMNKTDLMASGPDKLNIDLFFRNWSLDYQYTKQFTQMGRIADLITKISIEQIIDSGLKNLMCSISPVTLSIKNYVVTKLTANIRIYKTTDECLQRVREFYANRPFVVPSQRVETCYYMLKKFPGNQDLQFEATDEFEDALTTPRNTASMRLNPHTDLTSFMITLQCERNSNGALTFEGLYTQNQNVSVEL